MLLVQVTRFSPKIGPTTSDDGAEWRLVPIQEVKRPDSAFDGRCQRWSPKEPPDSFSLASPIFVEKGSLALNLMEGSEVSAAS